MDGGHSANCYHRRTFTKASSLKYIVIVSFICQPDTIGKRENSLKDCFHWIVLFNMSMGRLLIIS